MAVLDAEIRGHDRRLRQAWLDERAMVGAVDGLLTEWFAKSNVLFHEIMILSGCHQHKRMWRKRRMSLQERTDAEKRVNDLLDRIATGDPSAEAFVKRSFDLMPEPHMELYGGDLAARVVGALTDRLAGTHLMRREAVARKLKQVLADLTGPDPTPGERLLAERAAVCWLATWEADLACQNLNPSTGAKVAGFIERRHDRAQRRFLAAVKALAVFRRLALPPRRPVVNFGGRLAGAVAAGRN
jgi:hypothetical protein